jgi:CRISPR-associated protein Cmr2
MTDAILIFTFSPVQSFISEARRAGDLYAGSKILSRLANAVVGKIIEEAGDNSIIYPSSRDKDDAPNVIVARVPSAQAATIAEKAKENFMDAWTSIANSARREMEQRDFQTDNRWNEIWNRQTGKDYFWQIYWAAAEMESDAPEHYIAAYERAREALNAIKQSRTFQQFDEYGFKDSLSGQREALRTASDNGKEYWKKVGASQNVTVSELRKDGAERLDAFGAIKRFGKFARDVSDNFPSVSTVASAPFAQVCSDADLLAPLAHALEQFNAQVGNKYFYHVDDFGRGFPFDGDLLYRETFEPERLKASYGVIPESLTQVTNALDALYREARNRELRPAVPSPYYALFIMDGDSMGRHVSACRDEQQHRELSQRLASFTKRARDTIVMPPRGFLIYAGGDDVLALAPLQEVMQLALELQAAYRKAFEGWSEDALPLKDGKRVPFTVSAGIAIAHHLYPLDAALEQARHAEKQIAKQVPDKSAVGISIIKRSGETVHVRSRWDSMGDVFQEMREHFEAERISSRFAYELYERAHIVTDLNDDAREAAIKQLVKRHKSNELSDANRLVKRLANWAKELDDQVPPEKVLAKSETVGDNSTKKERPVPQGLVELGRWLVFARFVAQGGNE